MNAGDTYTGPVLEPLSLYIHIPYCRTICTYCAFNVYPVKRDEVDPFLSALLREIEILGRGEHGPVHTISFGGGTPSLMSAEALIRVVTALYQAFEVQPDVELSLEANPNDLNHDYLRSLHRMGFNRLSIGVQSVHPDELALFKREHDAEMARQAVSQSREAGFENINLDLIFGIPGQTMETWQHTLRQVVEWSPDHLSLYGLELHGGTPLTKAISAGRFSELEDDLVADMYEWATDFLADRGYTQYEISNWCLPGKESRHNLQYWYNAPYLGLGPGAHGYVDHKRTINRRSPARYIESFNSIETLLSHPRTPATSKITVVTREDAISETIMMGMRLTREGISRTRFKKRFGVDLVELRSIALDDLARRNLIHVDEKRIVLTRQGRLLSNYVLREII